ncbi:CAP domain-containing protein [Silvimonas sp.]|uniref:CAP domain-containing protein n=1 Tax=Silvimonas sp. TaxID=2650811 RepID=UPI00283D9089|nr:CAP domain-containing protein [Silvimonas sp.]MDR3430219.1 hypothetical protein [Silvimonas sp.]
MMKYSTPSAPTRSARQTRQLALALTLQATLLLAACGGGGGSDSTTSTPTATPTPVPVATPTPTPTPVGNASGTAFAPIDTSNRAEVIARYQDSFLPLQQTAFSWTGNVGSCLAGDTPLAYKNAEVRLLNYYRAMAGESGNVTLSLPLAAKAQQAALMMDANSALNHSPPTSWTCYTADGATAAGSSNLALGSPTLNSGIGGPGLYIKDSGVSSLGHRRWVLYSRLAIVGPGDTPRANALWVLGNDGPAVTLANGVAWPPAGYVPVDSHIADPAMQWSFSYPGADFSAATVTVQDDAGNPVALTGVGQLPNGYGDNTLSWSLSTSASGWSRLPADTKLSVSIANVMIGGSARSFSYTVTFVQP